MPNGLKPKPFNLWAIVSSLVIAFVLLLGVFVLSFPSLISSNWGKEKLFRYLKSKYHVDVKCQRLSLEWFGHLEVTDLEVIDTEKKAVFTCDIIKTEANLWDLLFKKNFGHLYFDRPYLKISPSLVSLFSPKIYCDRLGFVNFDSARRSKIEAERGRPFPVGKADEEGRFGKVAASQNSQNLSSRSIHPVQRGALFPLGGTEMLWRFSLPYIGMVDCTYGKVELLPQGLEPVVFDEITLNFENSPRENSVFGHLACVTLQNGIQGKLHADAAISQMNTASPILKGQANFSQLPVEGVDELVSLFAPRFRGFLVQALGETADASLNVVSAAKNFDIDGSLSSPLLNAEVIMATDEDRVSLKKPAQLNLTLTPGLFQKLIALKPQMQGLILKKNADLQIVLNSFNSSIPHTMADLQRSSFDLEMTASSPLSLECDQTPVVLDTVGFRATSANGSIQFNGQASMMGAKKGGTSHLEGVYNPLSHEMSFSLTAEEVPADLLGQLSGWPVPLIVGDSLTIVASGNKGTDNLLRLEIQSPLLKVEKAVFALDDSATLRSAALFVYQITPETLHAFVEKGITLTQPVQLQGRINTLSFPLSRSLETMQLDLEASANQIELTTEAQPLIIRNVMGKLSVHTFNQIALTLSSDRLQASLMGKYDAKTGKFAFTQPLSLSATLDDALLHAEIQTPAHLMQPATFNLSIDPFSFPARAFSMQTLAFKGTASVDRLSLLPFKGAPEVALSQLAMLFQWDGPQKSAMISANAAVQEKNQSLGSLAFKGTFSTVQWDKRTAGNSTLSLEMQQMPSAFVDSLLGHSLFSPLAGPQFSTTVKVQGTSSQQTVTLLLSSPLLSVKSAFLADANSLSLSGTPTQIQWTLTPEGYKTLDALLTQKNSPLAFELKEPTRFQLNLSKFRLPLAEKPGLTLEDRIPNIRSNLPLLQCVGEGSNPSLIIVDRASQETLAVSSLAFSFNTAQNSPLAFTCDAAISSQSSTVKNTATPAKAGSLSLKGNIQHLFDEKGQINLKEASSQISLALKNFPSRLFDLLARFKGRTDYPFTKFFGPTIQASLQTDIKNLNGPVSLNVNSPNVRFSLDGAASRGGLILNQPIYAQMKVTKEMSTLFLNEVNPLSLSYFYSEAPVTFEISSKGFYLPLNPFNLSTLAIPSARIELGKIACRNEGNINATLGLLKSKQFDKNRELLLWFAPIDLHISEGVVDIERTEILLAQTFDIALWGKVLLLDQYVDMLLGLPADTLSQAFGVKNLPDDYVLTIPMKGKMDNVQINSSKATAKIALLIASQQKGLQQSIGKSPGGALLGGFLQQMATLPDNGKAPPAKHPFPWEKATSFEEDLSKPREKKTHFRQNEKPLKQLFKMIR